MTDHYKNRRRGSQVRQRCQPSPARPRSSQAGCWIASPCQAGTCMASTSPCPGQTLGLWLRAVPDPAHGTGHTHPRAPGVGQRGSRFWGPPAPAAAAAGLCSRPNSGLQSRSSAWPHGTAGGMSAASPLAAPGPGESEAPGPVPPQAGLGIRPASPPPPQRDPGDGLP